MPATPRTPVHVRPLTAAVTAAVLVGALAGAPTADAAQEPSQGLLLSYPFTELAGDVVVDASGNGRDGDVVGGAEIGPAGGLVLDGVDDHVELPDGLLEGLDAITVSVDVLVDPAQRTPYFLWGLGGEATSSGGTGYLFASGDAFRAGITETNWQGEQVTAAQPARGLDRGVWASVTYTQSGGTGVLYEDGVEVGRSTGITVDPADLEPTGNNQLGESSYAADNSLQGGVRDLRVYDRALDADEVAGLAPSDAERVEGDVASLDPGGTTAVTDDLDLPGQGPWGSSITWSSSDPDVLADDGEVTRPAAGGGPVTVVLTATATRGDAAAERSFEITVLPARDDASLAEEAAAQVELVHPDDVRGNLTLPTTATTAEGVVAQVAWTSSDPDVVGADGLVTRPAPGAGDVAVTLTASVTVGAGTATRTFELTVREARGELDYTGYVFSYFTGNSVAGEKIHLAASEGDDALQWQELAGGEPVLESTEGTRGLRDPFLIRSPEGDRFFLIATDLSIGRDGNWDRAQRQGSRYIEVWESTDLVTWSDQRHVLVSPETAGNTWAPEAFWDEENQEYVVFWASKLYAEDDPEHTGSTYNRMLYATTRDFVTFGEARIWQDFGSSRIDSTVIEEDGVYHRFSKDEGAGETGCSDIIQERSADLTAVDRPGDPSWEFVTGCIGRDAGTSAVEGPTVFEANPGDTSPYDYYLFVDEYGGRGYIPLGTDDLDDPDWTVPADFDLPASPRHGTVVPVTQAEHDRLLEALPAPEPEPGPEPLPTTEDGLVLHYPMDDGSGDVVADASGNGNDAALAGGAGWVDGALSLDGVDDHVVLPDDLMAGMDEITVSLDVRIAPDQPTPYFVWGMGNTTSGAGDGYLFTTGNGYRSSITQTSWTGEQTVSSGSDLPRDRWVSATYTLDADGTATLYLDGRRVGTQEGVGVDPGDVGGGRTSANYIGRSLYDADRYLSGEVRDFAVWDRALSAEEVAADDAEGTDLLAAEAAELKAPAVVSAEEGTVVLPVVPGTDVTALDVTYTVPDGSTVSVTGPTDYSSPVTVTVTAADGSTRDWTVTAVEMRSPVLPGYTADPNIVRFGDTYYIYATSDGFPGWSGSTFTVWSSRDLVDWQAHDLILDLGPDVSWADSRAWAPTAAEKDGTYYFYFSADQNIGVATADSPLGPFEDALGEPLVSKADYGGAQQIDPAVFTDDDGTSYLLWGNGTPRIARLGEDMTSLVPGTERVLEGLDGFREGLFLVRTGGTYHLTWSIDDTRSPDYRVGYATSDSLTGPWENHGVILSKDPSQGILGTGHHSMVQDPGTGDWYIAYHRFAIPGGDGTHREVTIDRIVLGEDGLFQPVVPTLTGVEPLEVGGQPDVGTEVSLADVLAEDGSGPEARSRAHGDDLDLLAFAVDRVLALHPDSPLAVLTDPSARLTAFLPDDDAVMDALRATGNIPNERAAAARLRTALSTEELEQVLLGHLVLGQTLTAADLAAADGRVLETAAGTRLEVRVGDAGVELATEGGEVVARVASDRADLNLGQAQVAHVVDHPLPPA